MYYFWNSLEIITKSLGFIIIITNNLSYLYTALANPGLGKNYEVDNMSSLRKLCGTCNIYYDKRKTFHCSYCDICVYGHDHHCPWVGKCIGEKNLIAFYIFVSSTFGMIMYLFLATIFAQMLLY